MVGEKATIVLKEQGAFASREQILEVVGEVTTSAADEGSSEKKKDYTPGPKTRASTIKRVHLTKKQQQQAEQLKRQEEYKETREQIREFRKVQAEVAKQQARAPEAIEEEIPQLRIREIVSVDQEKPETYDPICPGDILDLKVEPDLVIDE